MVGVRGTREKSFWNVFNSYIISVSWCACLKEGDEINDQTLNVEGDANIIFDCSVVCVYSYNNSYI